MPDVLDELQNAIELGDAAPLIRRSTNTLYRLATQGKVPCIRVNTKLYFRREDLITFVENSRPSTRKPPGRRSNAERQAAAERAAREAKALGC